MTTETTRQDLCDFHLSARCAADYAAAALANRALGHDLEEWEPEALAEWRKRHGVKRVTKARALAEVEAT